jgi:hypothetical protein
LRPRGAGLASTKAAPMRSLPHPEQIFSREREALSDRAKQRCPLLKIFRIPLEIRFDFSNSIFAARAACRTPSWVRAGAGLRSDLLSCVPSYPFCSLEDLVMRTTYDFAPLWRSTIGFDHLADLVESNLREAADNHYPPTTSSVQAKITIGSRWPWRASASTTLQ